MRPGFLPRSRPDCTTVVHYSVTFGFVGFAMVVAGATIAWGVGIGMIALGTGLIGLGIAGD